MAADLQTYELVPLGNVPDDHEFWSGTLFRLYNVGMNVKDKSEDFYEYMLVDDNDPDHMILANSSREAGRYKRGLVICHVKRLKGASRAVVTGAAMKFSFGTEHTY
ncbi:MAG: hypothetical protein JNM31_13380 [Flavobacteriales bacterium]|nr:hypothetical protein [Flavobacteriales bacterium]